MSHDQITLMAPSLQRAEDECTITDVFEDLKRCLRLRYETRDRSRRPDPVL
ncbi:hypothetical protein [Cryobacterium sp. TmT2-59]|uniref:hypothetical protein n=1 Tax=Cryobacterium sp. TmT2-59 TaxID=1259264 RepID=UPI00141AC528|nr:hypothetical protein [Cryobacterium sp. TmT2-59]